MKKLLLLLPAILFFATTFAQKEIKLAEARKHVGDSVSLTGWITGVRFLSNAKNPALFLEMNADKPNERLILMIMNKDDSRTYVSNTKARNKAVRVKGKIRLWNGEPVMVIHSEKQIATLQKETYAPTVYKH